MPFVSMLSSFNPFVFMLSSFNPCDIYAIFLLIHFNTAELKRIAEFVRHILCANIKCIILGSMVRGIHSTC